MGQLVVRVACGARHCGAVTAEGILLTWGGNDSGQLGHGDTAQLSRRRRVAALAREQVVLVACGRSHTLARTAGGALYAWGSHEFGQLGLGGDHHGQLALGGGGPNGESSARGSTADVLAAPGGASIGGASIEGASIGPPAPRLDAMRRALMPVDVPRPSGAVAWGEAACGEAHSAYSTCNPMYPARNPMWAQPAAPCTQPAAPCIQAHSAALTGDGGVLTWGCPDDGRLGQAASPDDEPDDGTPVCAPARVHVEGFIDQVARA
jgi:alpha-tubulin suppressor-like RCC1 family protein